MREKKIVLSIFLLLLSFCFGYTLGKLDFFGFISGQHTLNLFYLLSAFIAWHFIALITFILNFADKRNLQAVFLFSALAFAMMFFAITRDIFSTLLNAVVFFIFLFYTYLTTYLRAKMFVKFSPQDILFPILRQGFLFLLIIFATLGYFQAQKAARENSIVTTESLRTISKPLVYALNKHLGAQLQKQLGDKFETTIGTQDRKQIVHFVLAEILESFQEGQTRQIFGLSADKIPIHKTIVYDNGEIDLTPVVEDMLPNLSDKFNQKLAQFTPFIPFIIAIVVILLIQPLLGLFELLLVIPTQLLFKILFATKFIRIEKQTIEKEIVRL